MCAGRRVEGQVAGRGRRAVQSSGLLESENTLRVKDHGKVVAEIPNASLTDAALLSTGRWNNFG